MLENWLQAPKVAKTTLESWQFGANIIQYEGDRLPSLKKVKVALVGVDEQIDIIRPYLYQMAFSFSKLIVADVGNLRNATEEGLLPVLKELQEGGIFPIIISAESTPFTAQFKAYQDKHKTLNLVAVEERIKHHQDIYDYLSIIQKARKPKLDNLGFIGYQTHFSPTETIHHYQKKNFDCIRLGMAKSNMEQIEPVIRDAHTLYFHLSALKKAEAPGVWDTSPSGFTSEEACRICHYAGISDKLSSFGIYGYCVEKDQNHGHTAQLIAQMIWYVLQGFYTRKTDFPAATNQMVEYIVAFKQYDYHLTFWKSTKSGRWWVQVPPKGKKKSRLVPCSYEDYQQACQDELSERLLNIIERMG